MFKLDAVKIGETYVIMPFYYYNGVKYNHCFEVSDEEYNRFFKTEKMPITIKTGTKIWLNENGFYHRIDGPALITNYEKREWLIDGKQYTTYEHEQARKLYIRKSIYFFAQKIKLLQKLIEIPEIWDEVYYSHKNKFLALLYKI